MDKKGISISILWQAITQSYTSKSSRCSRVLTSTNSNPTYPLNKVSGHFMALRRDRLIHILNIIVAMPTVKDFITAGGSDATPPSVV
jgi:hypothetical protein